jgi:hypothetical protein
MKSVYEDFNRVWKTGIKAGKGKFVKRMYAFGEPNVPREESQWLKIVYGFDGNSVILVCKLITQTRTQLLTSLASWVLTPVHSSCWS